MLNAVARTLLMMADTFLIVAVSNLVLTVMYKVGGLDWFIQLLKDAR